MSEPIETEPPFVLEPLRHLRHPVTIAYYTPDVPSGSTLADRRLLQAIANSSDRVELRVRAGRWDALQESRVGIARTPAIVPTGARDYGIRYYGTPDGYELGTFVSVLLAVSEGRSDLSRDAVERVQRLTARRHLEVLHAPT